MRFSLALRIYFLGLALYLASLFLPAYSPLGAIDYTGWNALAALFSPRLFRLLDAARPHDIPAVLMIVAAALSNLLAILSPLLFALHRRFRHGRWLHISLALLLISVLFALSYTLYAGYIRLRYGSCLWLLGLILISLSLCIRGDAENTQNP